MSESIRHRIEIEASPDALVAALSTKDGLAQWWTPMVDATPEVGSIARFRFGDGSMGPDMRVDAVGPEGVEWTCIDGPWVGHRFRFRVSAHERGSVLVFAHEGWDKADDFYMHCNAKWGFFLAVSLKSYLETGTGTPHPQDPSI